MRVFLSLLFCFSILFAEYDEINNELEKYNKYLYMSFDAKNLMDNYKKFASFRIENVKFNVAVDENMIERKHTKKQIAKLVGNDLKKATLSPEKFAKELEKHKKHLYKQIDNRSFMLTDEIVPSLWYLNDFNSSDEYEKYIDNFKRYCGNESLGGGLNDRCYILTLAWDRELNLAYKALVKILSKKEQQSLKKAQRVWVKSAGETYSFTYEHYNKLYGTNGSMWRMMIGYAMDDAMGSIKKERTLYLRTLLRDKIAHEFYKNIKK